MEGWRDGGGRREEGGRVKARGGKEHTYIDVTSGS